MKRRACGARLFFVWWDNCAAAAAQLSHHTKEKKDSGWMLSNGGIYSARLLVRALIAATSAAGTLVFAEVYV